MFKFVFKFNNFYCMYNYFLYKKSIFCNASPITTSYLVSILIFIIVYITSKKSFLKTGFQISAN